MKIKKNINVLKVYKDLIKEVDGLSSYTYLGGIFIQDNTQKAIIFDRNNIYLYYDLKSNITKFSLWSFTSENDLRFIIKKHIGILI